ncbi:Dyp-type peroxidase [Falsiruegeria mediterranea]
MIKEFNPEDVQGNILRGYRLNLVRHLVLEVTNRTLARQFLAAAASGSTNTVPTITRESSEKWTDPPKLCFNIGVTFAGLQALGVTQDDLETFPTEFRQGMAKRAAKIGDFGDSAPQNWAEPFNQPERVHLIASIYSDPDDPVEQVEQVQAQISKAFTIIGVRDGRGLPEGKVFFGYRDSISQPRFEHVPNPTRANDNEPINPLGTVLLGYPTHYEGILFRVPTPNELGHNGAFNAFRVLAQDTVGFEKYLSAAATELETHPEVDQLLSPGAEENIFGMKGDRHGALREVVAAQMCGRWRNGMPYEKSPNSTGPIPNTPGFLTNFDYDRGSRCPVGSHTRRANPRNGHIVQRMSNYSRRIVRRGMSYGPNFDPTNLDDGKDAERGLLGNFLCANLGAQFEAVMCDWVNVGLQDPDITGASDPLLGANEPETSWFDLTLANGGSIRLRGFPRFIKARGGAYTFLPSLSAIAYLSKLET